MKIFLIFLCFQFSAILIYGQTNFEIAKSDSSKENLVYSVHYKKESYLLSLRKDTSAFKIIILLRRNNRIHRIIIEQEVEFGETIRIRGGIKKKFQVLYIEIGSNVLCAHEIHFGKKINFKRGVPLKGKYLNNYYNHVIENHNNKLY